MPSLQTVADTTEEELIAVLMAAWGVSKVHTAPPETEAPLSAFPQAFLFLQGAEPSDEGEGSLCSESAQLLWHALLFTQKPQGQMLAKLRRQRAQELRTELAATDFTYAPEALWRGDDYSEPEDLEVQATSQAYAVRVRFTTFVEWDA